MKFAPRVQQDVFNKVHFSDFQFVVTFSIFLVDGLSLIKRLGRRSGLDREARFDSDQVNQLDAI